MALGLLAEWYVVEDRGLGRIMKFASLPVFAGLLVISRSMTSIVTVGATIVILWLFERFHRRYHIPLPAILLFLAGLLVCVALFGIDTSIFTEMMGRSRDLTGRTDLMAIRRFYDLGPPIFSVTASPASGEALRWNPSPLRNT